MAQKTGFGTRKYLAAILLPIMLILIGAWIFSTKIWYPYLERALENAVADKGAFLSLKMVEGRPGKFLKFENIRYVSADSSVYADIGNVDVAFRSVFHLMRLNFEDVRISSLQLSMHGEREAGISEARQGVKGGGTVLSFRHLTVEKSRLQAVLKDTVIDVRDIGLSGSFRMNSDTLHLTLEDTDFRMESREYEGGGSLTRIDEILKFTDFHIRSGSTRLEFTGKLTLTHPLFYQVHLKADPFDLADLPVPGSGYRGLLRAEIQAEGGAGTHYIEAEGSADLPSGEYILHPASFVLGDSVLNIVESKLDAVDVGTVSARGLIRTDSTLSLVLDMALLPLERYGKTSVRAEAELEGHWRDSLRLDLSAGVTREDLEDTLDVAASFLVNSDTVTILDAMILQLSAGQAVIRGRADTSDLDLQIETHLSGEPLRSVLPLINSDLSADAINIVASLNGSWRDPDITGDFSVNDLALVRGMQGAENLRGFFRLEKIASKRYGDIYVVVKKARVAHLDGMDGLLIMENKRDTLMLRSLQLSNGSDRVESSARILPDRKLSISGLAFRIDDHRLQLDSVLAVNLNPAADDSGRFRIAFDKGAVDFNYTRKGNREFKLLSDLRNIDAGGLFTFFTSDTIPYSGAADGQLRIEYRDGDLMSDVQLRAVNGSILGRSFNSFTAEFSSDSLLKFRRFELSMPDDRKVSISGTLPLKKNQDRVIPVPDATSSIFMTASMENLDLSPLSGIIPKTEMGGRANGVISLSGTLENTLLSSTLNIKDGKFGKLSLGNIYGKISYADSVLLFESVKALTGRGEYLLSGTLPVTLSIPKASVTLNKHGSMSLFVEASDSTLPYLTAYIPVLEEMDGNFKTELKITGTPADPVRNGFLKAEGATVLVSDMGNAVTNVTGTGSLTDNILKLDLKGNMKGRPNESQLGNALGNLISGPERQQVAVTGNIDMTKFFRPVLDLRIRGRNLYYTDLLDNMTLVTDADLHLKGQRAVTISGDLNLVEGIFRNEFGPKPLSPNVLNPGSLAYEIRIPVRNDTYIRNSMLDAELQGEIILTKQNGQTGRMSGELDLLNGKFYYYSSIFDIDQGNIIFDPNKGNHSIEFAASTPIGDGSNRIVATLSGELNKPSIQLYDEEGKYLSQGQLIQILTTGILPDNGSGSADVFSGTAQNIVGAVLEKEMERTASDLGGFSRVDFRTNSSTLGGAELDSMSILLGRRLGKNVYLTYERSLSGNTANQELEVEYRINRNISVIGAADEESVSAAFRLRFQY